MSSRSASESSGSGDEDKSPNISSSVVAEKYKVAAKITADALRQTKAKCKAGASVVDLCQLGDSIILQQTAAFSKKAEYKKGIAFPTCLSLNGHLAHFSPLRANDTLLQKGDLVKLEMGAHLDGYIAISAQSFVVGATKENPVTGKKADVILAAYYGAEAAIRSLKVGAKGQEVADIVLDVSKDYQCRPVENMLFYVMTQDRLEGEESILINGTVEGRRDHRQPDVKEYDVYAVDVLVSSGKGTCRMTQLDASIFKIEPVHYSLKSKRSRQFFTYANTQFGLMPFNLRYFETDENNKSLASTDLPELKGKDGKSLEVPNFVTCKMGIKECREHGLMTTFDVQQVEEGEFTAQFKFTVLVYKTGPERITALVDFDPSCYSSQYSIQNEKIQNLLTERVDIGKSKKKKKKKVVVKPTSAVISDKSCCSATKGCTKSVPQPVA